MKFKRNIAVDFDGVLNEYKGYNKDDLSTPKEGVEDFLRQLNKQYNIIVFTARNKYNVERWLKFYRLDDYITAVTNRKPPAVVYIDDRALRFDGDYTKCLETIDEKAYWQKKED